MSNLFFITWVTHNSRYSERMAQYKVPKGEPLLLDLKAEIVITEIIKRIVLEDSIIVLSYNICKDHVHILIECPESSRDGIVRKLKGKSALLFGKGVHPLVQSRTREYSHNTTFHLWGQKYFWKEVENDKQLENTINYISENRTKHELSDSKRLQELISEFTTSI